MTASRLSVVAFEPVDLDLLEPGPYDRAVMAAVRARADFWEGKGISVLDQDGKCLGCLFVGVENETANIAIVASDELRTNHGLWMGLMLRRGLAGARKMGVARLECEIEDGFEKARDLVEAFGFMNMGDGVYERSV